MSVESTETDPLRTTCDHDDTPYQYRNDWHVHLTNQTQSYDTTSPAGTGQQPRKSTSTEPPVNPLSVPRDSLLEGPMDSAWPMYCYGIRHTGQSPYNTLTNLGGIKWIYKTGGGIDSSPAIDKDDTIYIGSNDYYIHAIDLNGVEKWRFGTGFWVTSSPAISDDGTIYLGSWDGYFYAINPNGTLKWRFSTQDTVRSSPAIAYDGTIYFGVLGPGTGIGRVYALHSNGTEKWHIDTGNWVYSSAALDIQGTIYFTSNDGNLYAINPNGTIKWTYGIGSAGSPAIGGDGTIYIASHDGFLYAVYPNSTMKWRSQIGWGSGHVPSIANDGTIYIGGDELYAIYPNGSRKWAFNPGRFYDATSESQAISANGTIYFGVSNDTGAGGYLIAVNPNGTEKWREWIHNYEVYSSPAIGSDGTVYIGSKVEESGITRGYLYAFNGNKFEDPVIEKPLPGKLYVLNKERSSTLFGNTICIGPISVDVTHPDPVNITKIEFYVDNVKHYEVTTPPYQWTWRQLSFGKHTITITAVKSNNITKSVRIDVLKFF